MDDPYQILGVGRDAGPEEIKKAFRKLARGLHPDLHPGDQQAEERFKRVNAAYSILSDPAQKARFDAGEIDASGAERPRGPRRGRAGARAGGNPFGQGGFGGSAEDIFEEMLRRRDRGRGAGGGFGFDPFGPEEPLRGADAHYVLHVSLGEAVLGATRRIVMPSGKSLDVKVPRGTGEGTQLRLKGQGHPSDDSGGEPGDALIEIRIDPHPLFTRDGDDLRLELPVTLPEAVLGAKVNIPTIDGQVALTIPPGSNSGTVLRLKGKGATRGSGRGDQLVTLRVVLPDRPDPELEAFLKKWQDGHPYSVRDKLD